MFLHCENLKWLDEVRNLIPGHKKFAPDLQIAKSHYKSDVFNEIDLQLVVEQFGFVTGNCTDLEGESGWKIFPIYQELEICMPANQIVMKVREKCCSGLYVILLQRPRKISPVQIYAFLELQIRTKQGGILDL